MRAGAKRAFRPISWCDSERQPPLLGDAEPDRGADSLAGWVVVAEEVGRETPGPLGPYPVPFVPVPTEVHSRACV